MTLDFNDSGPAALVLILLTTYLHEDAGIIAAGACVVEGGMSIGAALAALLAGILSGDFLIYGAGRAARTVPWIRRMVMRQRVEQAREWLARNVVLSVAVCRLLPGVLFPTFAACGLLKVPFFRFAATTTVTAILYTPLMLLLAIGLKKTVLSPLGPAAWGILLLAAVLLTWLGARHKRWGFLSHIRLAHGQGEHLAEPVAPPAAAGGDAADLSRFSRVVAPSERIPPVLFYVPVGLRWLRLAARHRSLTLPSAANPMIEGGGMWGESKSRCLDMIGAGQRRWVAPFVTLRRTPAADPAQDAGAAVAAMQGAGIAFPVVVKPDIGWQGFGVRLVPDAERLRGYLAEFPAGELLILQQHVPFEGEAGVFYARMPGEETGRIISLVLRFHPYVIGDGATPLRELVRRDRRARFKSRFHLGAGRWHRGPAVLNPDAVPAAGEKVPLAFIGSIRVGGLYRDACRYVTPELTGRFDAIARSMPEFHYGRFDLRFRSLDSLRAGEDFLVFEVNGAGAEMIHAWDPEKPLREVYRTLLSAQDLLFEIGARNRARGFAPAGPREFLRLAARQHRLITRYPASG